MSENKVKHGAKHPGEQGSKLNISLHMFNLFNLVIYCDNTVHVCLDDRVLRRSSHFPFLISRVILGNSEISAAAAAAAEAYRDCQVLFKEDVQLYTPTTFQRVFFSIIIIVCQVPVPASVRVKGRIPTKMMMTTRREVQEIRLLKPWRRPTAGQTTARRSSEKQCQVRNQCLTFALLLRVLTC